MSAERDALVARLDKARDELDEADNECNKAFSVYSHAKSKLETYDRAQTKEGKQ